MQPVKGEKIMYAAINLIAIVSLLISLASAGGATKDQAQVKPPPEMYGKNLNHNETLVRDTAPVK